MNVHEVVSRCSDLGVILAPGPGGTLRAAPPGRLPEGLREELRRYKAEILAVLSEQAEAIAERPDYRILYRQMTQAVPEDMPIVDTWLAEHHPALWRKIRDLDDELIHLEQQGAPESTYQAKLNELVAVCQEAKALREGHWGALLVKSALLGTEVWVIKDEAALALVKADDQPVFFADEIALLKGKAPEQIKDILKAKAVFPGCRVVQ